ncbi:MAG: zinc-ribbon domain-containing protein [Eubacteriales bacterium]|nr:zinc-ribbon domain-containing protein [Eubacteriales bacterium]
MKQSLYDFCIENNKSDLLQQWDGMANGEMTPKTITYGSGRKAWWRCERGHTWQAVINSRSNGCGCPVCAGKVALDGENDLKTEMSELAKQWHPVKNMPLTPSQITKGSHRLIWWRCEKGHEWRASVKSRAEGSGCPICAGRKLLVGENDLVTVCPDLATQWHSEKNGTLKPEMVLATTARRVWWRCDKGHEWQARVKDRMNGNGCPVCCGQKAVAGVNDLESSYPLIAVQWHPIKNGKRMPRDITASSNRRVWWQCGLGHEWKASVCTRTREQTGCPYCANRKVLAGFNDLATLNPRAAKEWHPTLNGSLTPEQVTIGSRKKVWWICSEGHVWKTAVYARTREKSTGCPVCAGNVSRKRLDFSGHSIYPNI